TDQSPKPFFPASPYVWLRARRPCVLGIFPMEDQSVGKSYLGNRWTSERVRVHAANRNGKVRRGVFQRLHDSPVPSGRGLDASLRRELSRRRKGTANS